VGKGEVSRVTRCCDGRSQAAERCVVEFRRTSGDCFQFHEVYKKLSALLADLVWSEVSAAGDGDDDHVGGSGEELISDEAMMI